MRALCLLLILSAAARAARADELPERHKRSKIVAAASIGAIHAAYATWSYFAWYRDRDSKKFSFAGGSPFDPFSYAGGADKLGHFWTNYTLSRGTTALLVAGGWRRLPSSLVAAALTEFAFTLTEIEDGYIYAFEYNDMIANVAGSAFAVAMENVPALDRFLDFRVQYFPSPAYRAAFRRTRTVDIAQDYSGQSYILAFHVGALPGLQDHDWGYWSRYVDLALGFEAKHYLPEPDASGSMRTQRLYFGISLNMQGILRELLPDSTGRRIAHGAFEVYSLPYTTFRYVEASRVSAHP